MGKPLIGWNGQYLIGRWTPIIVPVSVQDSGPVQLSITAVDSDGNRVEYLSPEVRLDPGEHQLSGLIKIGRLDGEISIGLNQQQVMRAVPGKADWVTKPLKPSTRLVVTVGSPRGFDFESNSDAVIGNAKVAAVKTSDLPVDPTSYDSVSSLVIAGTNNYSADQLAAIRDWVSKGGRLVISLPHDSAAARKSIQPFVEWIPIQLGDEPIIVREFGGLESFTGKNVRIPQTSTLPIPAVKAVAGEILAASRADAFVVQAPYGMGAVTVLAMDLTSSPLADWKALPALCAKLTGTSAGSDVQEKTMTKGSQLSSTGITDLATQLNAIQENFERVHRFSPWSVMGLLMLLMLIVGPLDYLLVQRVLKKSYLTWITFPVMIVVFTGFASLMARTSNGSLPLVNQLDIVNVDVATSKASSQHFFMLYSPSGMKSTISVKQAPLVESKQTEATLPVIWQGVPESAFGGMFRESGFERGAQYQRQVDGQLTGLPLIQWSSKSLMAEGEQSAEGLVDCDLKASATGRLTGTITHRFQSDIEDAMVAYKNVVYRQLKSRDDTHLLPIPPKQVWRVDQPSVYSRELRPYITGMFTMATPRFGERSTTDFVQRQSTYDPLSLDPYSLVRILTFHNSVGAETYTGLTNQLLDDQDCSQLLNLGRAILFGRIKQPVATIRQDQTPVVPDRQTTFVRVILPVTRSTEVMKELRRVVPD